MVDSAPTPADPFAPAKANLRDTVKWLATTFAGLAAVVLAGTSLTGVSHLKGMPLTAALMGGGFGLICVILAAGMMLRLLTSESFFVGDLDLPTNAALKGFLDSHATDILPPELPTVDHLLKLRLMAMERVRQFADRPDSKEFGEANRFLAEITAPLSRLTNLAHFEVMRGRLKDREPVLFLLAVGALVGLGIFAVFTGSMKDAKSDVDKEGVTIQFRPGVNWSVVGNAFAVACGDKAVVKAQVMADSQPGWVRVRLLVPEACSGIVIPMPAAAVALGTTPPAT